MDSTDRQGVESSSAENDVAGAVSLGFTLCLIVSALNVAISLWLSSEFKGYFFARLVGSFFAVIFIPVILASLFQISKHFRGAIGFFQVLFWSLSLKLLWSCGMLIGSL